MTTKIADLEIKKVVDYSLGIIDVFIVELEDGSIKNVPKDPDNKDYQAIMEYLNQK